MEVFKDSRRPTYLTTYLPIYVNNCYDDDDDDDDYDDDDDVDDNDEVDDEDNNYDDDDIFFVLWKFCGSDIKMTLKGH